MKKLTWDSDFWGIDVYNVENSEKIEVIKNKKYLFQTLLDRDDLLDNSYHNNDFQLIETKINLVKEIKETKTLDKSLFRAINEEDLVKYKNEFFDLFGKNSRFRIFPKQKVNDFYYIWLLNSIKEEYDSYVIGFFIENNLAGFITYKILTDSIHIGLVGVFKDYQRQGISSKMIQYVENQLIDSHLSKIRISTNSFNLPALNNYIKNGFLIEDIKYWYYRYNIE